MTVGQTDKSICATQQHEENKEKKKRKVYAIRRQNGSLLPKRQLGIKHVSSKAGLLQSRLDLQHEWAFIMTVKPNSQRHTVKTYSTVGTAANDAYS